MNAIKVSVIIPAYNEEGAIGKVCRELIEYLDMEESEIIVVDDGSTDNTAKIVEQIRSVRLVRHRKNRGYGSGIRTGTKEAKGDIVVWYDADGQHRPEDLLQVIQKMQEENLDYCIGVRGKDSFQEKSRRLGKSVLRLFLRVVTGEESSDFNSGLRAFRRKLLLCYLPLLPKGFGASTVTTLLMQQQEFVGGEVPIKTLARTGKSTVKQFRDGFRTMGLIMNVILLFRPMKVFGSFGLFFFLLGAVYGIYCAFTIGLGIPVLSASLMIFGLQLICFGVLSHQISSMRMENYYNLYEQ